MRNFEKGETTFIPTPQEPEKNIDPSVPDMIVRPGAILETPFERFQSGIIFIAPKPPLTESAAAELARKIGHMARHDN